MFGVGCARRDWATNVMCRMLGIVVVSGGVWC